MRALRFFTVMCFACITSLMAQRDIKKCEDTGFVTADGTACKTIEVKNNGTAGLSVTFTCTFANGSTASVTLGQLQKHTFICHITEIKAHETVNATGQVTWTVT